MTKRLIMGLCGLGMLLATAAYAEDPEEGNGPAMMPPPTQVKFDRESGCWPAKGWLDSDAVDFAFKVKKPGTFLFVQMVVPPGVENTGEFMGGRDVAVSLMKRGQWVGNLDMTTYDQTETSLIGRAMQPGDYAVSYSPRALWGGRMLVRFCHSMESSFTSMPQ